jgi:hypothetical protein
MLRYPHTFAVELRQFSEFLPAQPGPAAKERLDPLISHSSRVAKLYDLEFRQVFRESCHVLGSTSLRLSAKHEAALRGGGLEKVFARRCRGSNNATPT